MTSVEEIIKLNEELDILNSKYNTLFDFYKTTLELLKSYEEIENYLPPDSRRIIEENRKQIEIRVGKIVERMEKFDE